MFFTAILRNVWNLENKPEDTSVWILLLESQQEMMQVGNLTIFFLPKWVFPNTQPNPFSSEVVCQPMPNSELQRGKKWSVRGYINCVWDLLLWREGGFSQVFRQMSCAVTVSSATCADIIYLDPFSWPACWCDCSCCRLHSRMRFELLQQLKWAVATLIYFLEELAAKKSWLETAVLRSLFYSWELST